jgi:hypothetical protein
MARTKGLELPSTFLRRTFTGCTVPDWYENVVQIPWNVIWNLNIDDVLQNAYAVAYAAKARQTFQSVSWDGAYVFHRQSIDSVAAVQLHGSAARGNLIFGSMEYLAAIARGGSAHKLFWDSWAIKPVIVVGASLSDELDMAAPLSEGRLDDPDDPPSLAVLPTISDFDTVRLSTSGLTTVPMTGAEFFEAVMKEWPDAAGRAQANNLADAEGISPSRIYFLQHFRPLRQRVDRAHDFFAGDAPVYNDILEDRDSPRILRGLSEPLTVAPDGQRRLIAFSGGFSGTSTAELRFIREAEKQGLRCLEYDGEYAFNPAAVAWVAQRDPKLLLRISDLDDFPVALTELFNIAAKREIALRVVTSLRSDRVRVLENAAGDALHLITVPDQLRDREINSLLATLERHHRLNTLNELSLKERFTHFSQAARRSLVDGLSCASSGRGFIARYRAEYSAKRSELASDVLDLVILTSEIGYAAPIGIIARAVGKAQREIAELIHDGGPVERLIYLERGLIRPRQASLAARLSQEQIKRDRRYELCLVLAKNMAPFINPATIAARTRYTRTVGQLMDGQRIYRWFGREGAEQWFVDLYDEYSWNSRYWEQRALAELEDPEPRYEKAEAWAHEAIAKHRDPFSLNTLATVLMRSSTAGKPLDYDVFESGLQAAEDARRAAHPSEHPYTTAMFYLRRAYKLASDDATKRHLRRAFNNWYQLAIESPVATASAVRDGFDEQRRLFYRQL